MSRQRSLALSVYTTVLGAFLALVPKQELGATQAVEYTCYEDMLCVDAIMEHQANCDPWTQAAFCVHDSYECGPGGVKVYCGYVT